MRNSSAVQEIDIKLFQAIFSAGFVVKTMSLLLNGNPSPRDAPFPEQAAWTQDSYWYLILKLFPHLTSCSGSRKAIWLIYALFSPNWFICLLQGLAPPTLFTSRVKVISVRHCGALFRSHRILGSPEEQCHFQGSFLISPSMVFHVSELMHSLTAHICGPLDVCTSCQQLLISSIPTCASVCSWKSCLWAICWHMSQNLWEF